MAIVSVRVPQAENNSVFVFTPAAYVEMLYRLRNGLCVFCHNRGRDKPCLYNSYPVSRTNKQCNYFKMWRVKKAVIKNKGG